MVTSQKMEMGMHILGAMYAPSDKVTIVVMTNVLENKLSLLTRPMKGSMNF